MGKRSTGLCALAIFVVVVLGGIMAHPAIVVAKKPSNEPSPRYEICMPNDDAADHAMFLMDAEGLERDSGCLPPNASLNVGTSTAIVYNSRPYDEPNEQARLGGLNGLVTNGNSALCFDSSHCGEILQTNSFTPLAIDVDDNGVAQVGHYFIGCTSPNGDSLKYRLRLYGHVVEGDVWDPRNMPVNDTTILEFNRYEIISEGRGKYKGTSCTTEGILDLLELDPEEASWLEKKVTIEVTRTEDE